MKKIVLYVFLHCIFKIGIHSFDFFRIFKFNKRHYIEFLGICYKNWRIYSKLPFVKSGVPFNIRTRVIIYIVLEKLLKSIETFDNKYNDYNNKVKNTYTIYICKMESIYT